MSGRDDLATVLDLMVNVCASLMDSARPSDEEHACPMCDQAATEALEHDPDCGYRLARTRLSPLDVTAVRRLVRVLRYTGAP